MSVILFDFKLDEPAIFTSLQGEPNSSVSYDFIPGSAIRGMLIGQYKRVNKTEIDPHDEIQNRLFFSGDCRYLNAYPQIEGLRALPVPNTWQIPKYQSKEDKRGATRIKDTALAMEEDSEKKVKPKSLSGFTLFDENKAQVYKPKRMVNIHTQRARKSSEEQLVYRYDALAAQQIFTGAILCDDEEDANRLAKLFAAIQHVNMGGARTAGYGRMSLVSYEHRPSWDEVQHDYSSDCVLTFLSDTILKNQNGEYLSSTTGIKAALEDAGLSCELEAISLKRGLVGGFNRKWGLPLPQIPVIERGSVVRLSGLESLDSLKSLVQQGLGEQTLDGFGRIAINWQRYQNLVHLRYQVNQAVEKTEMSEESKTLWAGIQERINRRTIDERMVGIVYSDSYKLRGRISRSQLSRLRALIADELRKETPSVTVFTRFMEDIKGKAADKQFEDARLGSQLFKQWLRQPIFPELGQKLQSRDAFVLKLVDAVLERAHREKTGKN